LLTLFLSLPSGLPSSFLLFWLGFFGFLVSAVEQYILPLRLVDSFHVLGNDECLLSYSRRVWLPSVWLVVAQRDPYNSSLNYTHQVIMVSYSSGAIGTTYDHNDWAALTPSDFNKGIGGLHSVSLSQMKNKDHQDYNFPYRGEPCFTNTTLCGIICLNDVLLRPISRITRRSYDIRSTGRRES
jgi:hypothetical protein